MKQFSFTSKAKLHFLLTFIYYKLVIFKDVKKGKLELYWAEILWIINVLTRLKLSFKRFIRREFFETRLGKFYIHPDIMSLTIVSPTFERLDVDYFISLIKKDLQLGKKVLVFDIGACFGVYAIGVATSCKKNKGLSIIAFEPNTQRFVNNNYELCKKNIKANNLTNIKLYKIGLGSKDSKTPNVEGIKTRKLDSVVGKELARKFDSVYIKIDIEGFEEDALRGAEEFLKKAKDVTLLVEDSVDASIATYLDTQGFTFLVKKTPYNSFWKK